jgi:hypothetical protein
MDKERHVTEPQRITATECGHLEKMALCLVNACVRNSLEDLHAGIFPSSKSGDYSDVKVVSPYGEIPWNQVGRISDAEMKELMITVVNRVFTFLLNPQRHMNYFNFPRRWEKPAVDKNM